MYNPDDYTDVLVVRMRNGNIESIIRESRKVYVSGKGRYIKTVGDGVVYISDENVAIISHRPVPIQGRDGAIRNYLRLNKDEPIGEVALAIQRMLSDFKV